MFYIYIIIPFKYSTIQIPDDVVWSNIIILFVETFDNIFNNSIRNKMMYCNNTNAH